MNRTLTLTLAAGLLITLAGCKGSSSGQPVGQAQQHTPAAATPTEAKTVQAKPSKSATPDSNPTPCGPERDVIVFYKVPGLPDSAQVLGNWDLGDCEPTFQNLSHTSPLGSGYCTEAAWASDNPGYNADATPAAPLKKIQVRVGPAC